MSFEELLAINRAVFGVKSPKIRAVDQLGSNVKITFVNKQNAFIYTGMRNCVLMSSRDNLIFDYYLPLSVTNVQSGDNAKICLTSQGTYEEDKEPDRKVLRFYVIEYDQTILMNA